jgi:arylsulfatase A-like enzyme
MPAERMPHILVILGEDNEIRNIGCYSDGLMGYRTSNIDRIAAERMRFTDSCGDQSGPAGRAALITGQSVFRTGLSKLSQRHCQRPNTPSSRDNGPPLRTPQRAGGDDVFHANDEAVRALGPDRGRDLGGRGRRRQRRGECAGVATATARQRDLR